MSFPDLPSPDLPSTALPSPVLPSQWTTLSPEHICSALTRSPLTMDGTPSIGSSTGTHPVDLHLYDELPSTNTQLWQLLASRRENLTRARLTQENLTQTSDLRQWHGTVAIARQQSAGKGQWGRRWQSSLGGLYLSLALEPQLSIQDAPHLIMSTVCGVAMAFRACGLPVAIKWPNDLVCVVPRPGHPSTPGDENAEAGPGPVTQQRPLRLCKLGGMLTETRIQGQIISHAVVGIGINGANPVPDPGITVRDLWHQLRENERLPAPLNSLSGLGAIAIYGILTGWQRLHREGIERILQDYNALLIHREQAISVNWQGQQRIFRVRGVSAAGDLRAVPLIEASMGVTSNDALDGPTILCRNATTDPKAGTSSISQASTEEIRFRPGTIQLGYHQPFCKTLTF